MFLFQANIKQMENDPLRWHGGIKISMAVAFNNALKGLDQQLYTVNEELYFYLKNFILHKHKRLEKSV